MLDNLIKGLDLIGIEYTFNEPIGKHKFNWIHDDPAGVIEASLLDKPVIIGPNIAVFPRDLPFLRPKLNPQSIYLQPCQWAKNMWVEMNFNEIPIEIWPVGIDLDGFKPNKNQLDKTNKKILIYFKKRESEILNQVESHLSSLKYDFEIIKYGDYDENYFKYLLDSTMVVIWVGCTESQGIAYQEVLAKNIPIIFFDSENVFFDPNIDVKRVSLNEKLILKKLKTTSAPYFDNRCGHKIHSVRQLDEILNNMIENINNYSPRQYVKENLSLKNQALKFVGFFEKIQPIIASKKRIKIVAKFLYYVEFLAKKLYNYFI